MANTGFQLEGSAAQLYEKYTIPSATGPAAERLLDKVLLKASDEVLDAACGTGIVIRLIAERYESVGGIIGTDLNDSMLDVARSLAPSTNFPVEWQQGDLCALPFPDSRFDVVLCNHGLQFVPDKPTCLEEIKRVLVPGGRFAFTVWSAEPAYNVAMANAIRRHIGEEVAKSCLAPFSFRDGDIIRGLLDDAGFQSIEMQEVGFTRRLPATADAVMDLAARSPYARDIGAASDQAREAIGQEFSYHLAESG